MNTHSKTESIPSGMTSKFDFHYLRESGLLWLINTTVFHPRGYALSFIYKNSADSGEQPIGWQLIGNGTDPFIYTEGIDESFEAVNKFFEWQDNVGDVFRNETEGRS